MPAAIAAEFEPGHVSSELLGRTEVRQSASGRFRLGGVEHGRLTVRALSRECALPSPARVTRPSRASEARASLSLRRRRRQPRGAPQRGARERALRTALATKRLVALPAGWGTQRQAGIRRRADSSGGRTVASPRSKSACASARRMTRPGSDRANVVDGHTLRPNPALRRMPAAAACPSAGRLRAASSPVAVRGLVPRAPRCGAPRGCRRRRRRDSEALASLARDGLVTLAGDGSAALPA